MGPNWVLASEKLPRLAEANLNSLLRRLINGIWTAPRRLINSRETYSLHRRLSCQCHCDGRRTDTGSLPACQCNGASMKLNYREGLPAPRATVVEVSR